MSSRMPSKYRRANASKRSWRYSPSTKRYSVITSPTVNFGEHSLQATELVWLPSAERLIPHLLFPDFSSAAACRAVGFQWGYCPRQVVQGRGDLPGAAAVGTRNRLRFIFHLGPSVTRHDDLHQCHLQPTSVRLISEQIHLVRRR
jgi:hypothetical protein